MHIPIQVDYGVRALVDLAENAEDGPIRASDIAQRQNIPEQYLARVLHTLQRHGITKAQRGPLGGHALARDPAEITMGAVMGFLGPPMVLVNCLDDEGECRQSSACTQRSVWRDVEKAIQQVLDATTIADLARKDRPEEESRPRTADRRPPHEPADLRPVGVARA